MNDYLSGERLYGDDLTAEQIAAWFEDEREGYARLGAGDASTYTYGYHALNAIHGFRHLPAGRIGTALGLGAAYGHEFRPILPRIGNIIIVEPSSAFQHADLDGVPLSYRLPSATGDLPADSSSIDLLTCFGVLHHIPNVSHVVKEIARVLKPGAHALLSEPIVSMGDWGKPRRGLTQHERGIPLRLFRTITMQAHLETVRETLCAMPLVNRLSRSWANSERLVRLDAFLSTLTAWNHRYHCTTVWQKVQPAGVYLVLRRPE